MAELAKHLDVRIAARNLDARLGEVEMAENEQQVATSDILVYFVYGFHWRNIIKDSTL